VSEPGTVILCMLPDTGEILRYDRPEYLPLKTRMAMLIGPLHVGEALGWPGRIIALLTCLILAALAGTSIWLWLKVPVWSQ